MSSFPDSGQTGMKIRNNLETCLSDLEPGSLVGIACSGGLDSTVLLFACIRFLRPAYRLCVFHVDHGIRPEVERRQEQQILVLNCIHQGIPLFIHGILPGTIRDLALSRGSGTEAAARSLRYQALDQLAMSQGAACVLAAHHRDDFIEGMTMGFFRGQYPLKAIPGIRGMYRRPFLGLSREELSGIARDWNLAWHEDSSNAGEDFLRNRVRHLVMPGLGAVFPGMARSLDRTARLSELDDLHFTQLLDAHAWQEVEFEGYREFHSIHGKATGLMVPTEVLLSMEAALAWRFLRKAALWFVNRGDMDDVPDALALLGLLADLKEGAGKGFTATAGSLRAILGTGSVILVPRIVSAHENDYLVEVKQAGCFNVPGCGRFECTGTGFESGFLPLVIRPLGTWCSLGLGNHPGVKSLVSGKARGIDGFVRHQGAGLGRAGPEGLVVFLPGPAPGVFMWNEKEKIWNGTECVRKAKESEFKL